MKKLSNLLLALAVAFVVRVVDGDTVEVKWDNGLLDHLRFIGINAPEMDEPGGAEAKSFVETLLLHQMVWVEGDVQERDKWGRYLGYVWLDGKMVNIQLVKAGFAVPAEYPPDTKYAKEIKEAAEK
jgi:endonuclease YncB( thermonuclease family)